MKLVILDSYALREGDLDWSGLRALVDEMVEWPRTPYEQAVERIGDAELVVVNKTYIDDPILDACPNLRWIGLTSTGTDNLDAAACRRHGVPVAKCAGLLDRCRCTACLFASALDLPMPRAVLPRHQGRLLADRYSAGIRHHSAVGAGRKKPSASSAMGTSAAGWRELRRALGCRYWSTPGRCAPNTHLTASPFCLSTSCCHPAIL